MRGNKYISKTECTSRLNAIGDALYVIGGKWTLRVVVALLENKRRFNEIQRSIDGLSARSLSAELKELELNGFVVREVDTGSPVTVEYRLTEYADSLNEVLDALSKWGTQHRIKIRSDRHLSASNQEQRQAL